MRQIELIATSTFGLEAVVKRELLNLGYDDLMVENGKITFKATEEDIPITNLWLRSADRVLLKMGSLRLHLLKNYSKRQRHFLGMSGLQKMESLL